MRKISSFGIFICLSLLAQFAQGQTMAEIISRHVAAMGGREKMMTLASVGMSGNFQAHGDTSIIPLSVNKKHMVGSRMDIIANSTNNYQVVTPENGWIFTPVQGDKDPRPLTPDFLRSQQAQLDLHGPFINTAEKGYKIEMAGKDTVFGNFCNNLKVTAPNGNVTIYSIDKKTSFILKASTKMFQFGAMEDVATTYGDYKQNEDGFWFSYSNVSSKGKTTYDKIIANTAVDVSIFKVK
jgi:hypothetical protein